MTLNNWKMIAETAKWHFQMTFSLPSTSCLLKLPKKLSKYYVSLHYQIWRSQIREFHKKINSNRKLKRTYGLLRGSKGQAKVHWLINSPCCSFMSFVPSTFAAFYVRKLATVPVSNQDDHRALSSYRVDMVTTWLHNSFTWRDISCRLNSSLK